MANSVSIQEDTPPILEKNNSAENIADYLMNSLTDSKDQLSKEDGSKEDNQIHIFEGDHDEEIEDASKY